jgi:hypothetical protein
MWGAPFSGGAEPSTDDVFVIVQVELYSRTGRSAAG